MHKYFLIRNAYWTSKEIGVLIFCILMNLKLNLFRKVAGGYFFSNRTLSISYTNV